MAEASACWMASDWEDVEGKLSEEAGCSIEAYVAVMVTEDVAAKQGARERGVGMNEWLKIVFLPELTLSSISVRRDSVLL